MVLVNRIVGKMWEWALVIVNRSQTSIFLENSWDFDKDIFHSHSLTALSVAFTAADTLCAEYLKSQNEDENRILYSSQNPNSWKKIRLEGMIYYKVYAVNALVCTLRHDFPRHFMVLAADSHIISLKSLGIPRDHIFLELIIQLI